MAAIDREVGGSTMIRISTEVRDMIEAEKIIPREPLNDCIKRGILQNRKCREQHTGFETRASLRTDLEEFVTNPNIGDYESYWGVWRKAHPDEAILPGDIIHHINGNHNDDCPENLMKTTRKEHGKNHADPREDPPSRRGEIVGK
jgi:hypothetical protein